MNLSRYGGRAWRRCCNAALQFSISLQDRSLLFDPSLLSWISQLSTQSSHQSWAHVVVCRVSSWEFERRAGLYNVKMHALEDRLQGCGRGESSLDAIADDVHRLANPGIVEKVDGILGGSWDTKVPLGGDEDVAVVFRNLGAPFLAVVVSELALGWDHGGHDCFVESWEFEFGDIDEAQLRLDGTRCIFLEDVLDILGDMGTNSVRSGAANDDANLFW